MDELENKIITAAKDHPQDVPPHLWNRLDHKLHEHRQSRKLKFYKFMSIAASFVAVGAVSTFLYYNSYKWNPQILAYSASENIFLEDLMPLQDDFYNPQKIALLDNSKAYQIYKNK